MFACCQHAVLWHCRRRRFTPIFIAIRRVGASLSTSGGMVLFLRFALGWVAFVFPPFYVFPTLPLSTTMHASSFLSSAPCEGVWSSASPTILISLPFGFVPALRSGVFDSRVKHHFCHFVVLGFLAPDQSFLGKF